MDQSTLRLPDPDPVPSPPPTLPAGERRSRVRQKLHSPVYASFSGPQDGTVVDLSELLDLHEEGFAVQTGTSLEVSRPVALTLDLPETRKFIHGNGQVVWSDSSGRGGIRFSSLPEDSQRLLREWLFANLLIACSNHAARSEQLSAQVEKPEEVAQELLPSAPVSTSSAPSADLSDMLADVDAVRRVVQEIEADRDAVFQLITARALGLTGASGAALAFVTGDTMVCRASAGETAPPMGTPVDVKKGLSGECVRSGLTVACQDTEHDSRVDPEICRTLGIGSFLAAPIVSDFRVVGLLEVFSADPRAFNKNHEIVLERLVEAIPKTPEEKPMQQDAATGVLSPSATEEGPSLDELREAISDSGPIAETIADSDADSDAEPPSTGVRVPSGGLYLGLMTLAIALVALTLGYLLAPVIQQRWSGTTQAAASQRVAATVNAQNVAGADADSPEAVRKLAEAGDADAQWRMGVRYHTGAGVLQDDVEAVKWFLRSAEQGHVTAQATLGAYYWAGRGVPQDLSRAYFWSALAFAQGDETSKSRLEGLSSQMTRTQVAAARQQADIWLQKHNPTKPTR